MRRTIALYGIGCFIQMNSLTQACEDKLIEGSFRSNFWVNELQEIYSLGFLFTSIGK